MPSYKRILLKLSGEALAGDKGIGYDTHTMVTMCREIKSVLDNGVEVAIVVGGGNLFRGLSASTEGMDRITGDTMGMLATVMNGLALRDIFQKLDTAATHMSAFPIDGIVEHFNPERVDQCLKDGKVVIFSGGTGNPFFSTDTASSLRAAQIGADVILKGTKVDGVYEADPVLEPSAKKFDTVTYSEVLDRELRVMDASAVAMCRENNIPIIVFNFTREGMLLKVVNGEPVGTIVKEENHG